jgi:GNAT superfamily N-acetyltransferase
MIEVLVAESSADLTAVRLLILGHAAALRDHPGSDAVRADAERLPGPYVPPAGRLYLARFDGRAAGCVALRSLDATTAELKRMYVHPTARRRGIAKALVERVLTDAPGMGYQRIRLGTLDEMTAAQTLYRELGFVEIPRYRPDELVDTRFFECHLTGRPQADPVSPHPGGPR